MSQFIRISITQGTSSGPFTIYYNTVTLTNIAQVYGPSLPYALANNITFAQLTNITNPLIIVVPDGATSIILVDNVNPCPPVILNIPTPTLTPTPTPTVTPTRLVGGRLTLQWVIRPQVPSTMLIPNTPINSNIFPANYGYGTRIVAGVNSYNILPPTGVTNNGQVISTNVVIPTLSLPFANIGINSSWVYQTNNLSPFNLRINLYINGRFISTDVLSQSYTGTQSYFSQATALLPDFTVGAITLRDNDVILIEYTT